MIKSNEPQTAPAPLLDPKAAAAYLGLSEWTLAEWRCIGSGPRFIKTGRLVRYAPEALQAWIEENTHSSTSSTGQGAA